MTAVTPDRDITVCGRAFTLSGTFAILKAIQHGFAQDLLVIYPRILDMRQDEVAKLLALASGGEEDEIGQFILDELDIRGTDYLLLKAELMAWLAVAITPRRDREKKVHGTERVLADLLASRGGSTGSSASASSAGPRKRSGKQPSGT